MRKLLVASLILFSINAFANSVIIESNMISAEGVDGKAACKAAHSEALDELTKSCTLAGGSSFKIVREVIERVGETDTRGFCNMFVTIHCEIDFN